MPGPVFTYDQIVERIIYATRDTEANKITLLAPREEWYLRTWLTDDNLATRADISYAYPTAWAEQEPGFQYGTQETGWSSYVLAAFELWDDLIATRLNATTVTSADITVAFSTTTQDGGSYMLPTVSTVGTNQKFSAARIWLNPAWNEFTLTPAYGGRAVETFLHEIGHGLGLFHPGPYNAGDTPEPSYADPNAAQFAQDTRQFTIMSYFNETERSGGPETFADYDGWFAATPLLYDVAAIQAKYGADPNTRTSNTTYGYNASSDVPSALNFSINLEPVFCIYDAGGIDTLDLSGSTVGTLLNLNPGTFSNALGRIGNIQIAFNTQIENAIGSGGADILIGNAANNVLSGGEGDDTLEGLAGDDILNGGGGFDIASWINAPVAINANLVTGSATSVGYGTDALISIEGLHGSRFGDRLAGNGQANTLYGHDGHDVLIGEAGTDSLDAGAGDDTLVGGADEDVLDGGEGFDTAEYLASPTGIVIDRLIGLALGGDAFGDALTSVERIVGSGFGDVIKGSHDAETFVGFDGNDELQGRGGNDTLLAGLGHDSLNGGAGADWLDGGDGYDTAFFDPGAPIVLNLTTGVHGGDLAGDVYVGIERFIGSAFDDVMTTSGVAEDLYGEGGHDLLEGMGGDDRLFGGMGNDTLRGGEGNDTLYGGSGTNVYEGGNGYDRVSFADMTSGVAFDIGGGPFSGVISSLEIFSIEDFEGSGYDDAFYGRAGQANYFYGGAGNDVLDGRGGGDVLRGDAGDDIIIVRGTELSVDGGFANFDTLQVGGVAGVFDWTIGSFIVDGNSIFQVLNFEIARGGSGADRFVANWDNLSFYGGAGSDVLWGGNGDNVLEGGAGPDELYFGGGFDYADYRSDTTGVLVDIRAFVSLNGDAAGDSWLDAPEGLMAGAGNDSLGGSDGDNRILGRGGNDYIAGYHGADTLEGGDGDDVIEDHDQVNGAWLDTAADSLSGGDGNDVLRSAGGGDMIAGGTGMDTLVMRFDGWSGPISFASAGDGTTAWDIMLNGTDVVATVVGIEALDILGSQFDDQFLSRLAGADTLDGGAGVDLALFDDIVTGVPWSRNGDGSWTITTVAGGSDTLRNIEFAVFANGQLDLGTGAFSGVAVPSAPDLAAASDSGTSNSDNVTRTTRPVFTGTALAGLTVTLHDGAQIIGSGQADAAGVWSITSALLSPGVHQVGARATDAGGNISWLSDKLTVTIDTTGPAKPTLPDLVAASDNGASDTDNRTNDTTPMLTGTAEALAAITLFVGSKVVGTGTATADGTWTITTDALADGAHPIRARATDAAGNISALSDALSIVIDTTVAPAGRPDLVAASDSGVSNTDNTTRVATPVFQGRAEAGATVTLFDSGTAIGSGKAGADLNWSIKSAALADGMHSIRAVVTDLAGNATLLSDALVVTVDTLAPATPASLRLLAASDSGVSPIDLLTNVVTTTLRGTGEAGTTVTLFDGSTVVGSAKVSAAGVWSIKTTALADGVHRLGARATDVAGNVGALSARLAVTIDTTGPSAPTVTAATTTTVSGMAEAASRVSIVEGGIEIGSTTSSATGLWSLPIALSPGLHTVTVTATDRAGNVGSALAAVTLDIGTGGADTLFGSPVADILGGGAGDDVHHVNDPNDVVTELPGEGTDTVIASVGYTLGSAASIEFLQADAGAPSLALTGNGLANTITGGQFDDVIAGAGGADQLFGGTGADVFALLALRDSTVTAAGRDTIGDFSELEGDLIDLAALDADTGIAGDQAFTFIGAAAFSGAGQLRAVTGGGFTVVSGDVNGDGAADFALRLGGVHALGAGHFVL